jgi:hypothetical protein
MLLEKDGVNRQVLHRWSTPSECHGYPMPVAVWTVNSPLEKEYFHALHTPYMTDVLAHVEHAQVSRSILLFAMRGLQLIFWRVGLTTLVSYQTIENRPALSWTLFPSFTHIDAVSTLVAVLVFPSVAFPFCPFQLDGLQVPVLHLGKQRHCHGV